MPATSEAEMAASMDRISPERPINGHDNRTLLSVRARKQPGGDYCDFSRAPR